MPCSAVEYPSSTLGLTPTSLGMGPGLSNALPNNGHRSVYNLRNMNYETNLILGRIQDAQNGIDAIDLEEQEKLKEKTRTARTGEVTERAGLTALDYRLRREERRRRLFRKSSQPVNSQEETPTQHEKEQPHVRTEAVVKDALGNEIYVRGESNEDKVARELDQWIKKMKCIGNGLSLEHFKDIKVGVFESDVVYGSPTYEPYPNLTKEKFTYSGGKDNKRNFHGKGSLELEDGSCVLGYWLHGVRHGDFKVESRRGPICFISGEYRDDKMNGKCKVHWTDGHWLHGYFKDGVLHGFCRYFDSKDRLTFLGMHRNGKPFGTCWKVIRGGGCVVGVVDEDGKLTGMNIAYVYPDFISALVGNFRDGILECAQACTVTKVSTDSFCVKIPQFSPPDGRLYRREISTYDFVTASPDLPDPYESRLVQVKSSSVAGANQGLFARKKIQPNTVLAFYHGRKVRPQAPEEATWEQNGYKIFDPSVEDGTVDIPEEYRSLESYSASLAHKTNHSFVPNSEFMVYNHPRFGVVPCIASKHTIAKDEEIFVRYGYELNYCPTWYRDAWEKGNYPVPESMKSEYLSSATSTSPAWAEATNDDKANQLPDGA